MTYYIADTHFGHENIIEMCNRPFSNIDEMNSVMINRWNKKVKGNDTIYVIGDMFFRCGEPELILKQLKGKKRLLIGNHDGSWMTKLNASEYFVSIDTMLTNPSFVPDYIYVSGGDPFKLLSEIRKRKLYSRIRRLVLTNKTSYIGVSAGAYIASKSIEYVKQLEDDDYEENEYRALGLVSNPIICHSDHYSHSQIKSCEIIAMAKSILIRDDQLVHLKSDNWHYIE